MRPRALVVEDDDNLREHYRIALEMSGFTVEAVRDGFFLLQSVEQRRPDIIVLDLNLPGVHGRNLYTELRAHPATASIPIVVVTGVEAPTVPGATILTKPVSADRLVRQVERALARCAAPRTALRDIWLYTRGTESVRIIVRCDLMHVVVEGPRTATAVHEFNDVFECMRYEARAERELVAAGFTRSWVIERRSGRERRKRVRGPERRREAQ